MEAVYYCINGKTLDQLQTRDRLLLGLDTWIIYVMDVLDCMARAADEMDADVSTWRNKLLAGEMYYFMVIRGG